MAAEKKIMCPLMRGECIKDGTIVDGELHACCFWVTVQGKHPQTGEVMNTSDCSFSLLPVLMIQTSKTTMEVGAAIESFRNEMVEANKAAALAFINASKPQSTQKQLTHEGDKS